MNLCYASLKLLTEAYRVLLPQDRCVFGIEQVPSGAMIIAANHPNYTDTFHLASVLHKQIHTLILADVFSIPVFGWMLSKAGQIPVHPNNRRIAMDQACDVVAQGGTILLYPEAQMNPENRRLNGKSGAVRMSLASGAPIVPLGIYVPENCTKLIKQYRNGCLHQACWQTSGQCTLRFGPAWLPAEEAHGEADEHRVGELTAILMEKIYTLADQAQLESLRDQPVKIAPKAESASMHRWGITPD